MSWQTRYFTYEFFYYRFYLYKTCEPYLFALPKYGSKSSILHLEAKMIVPRRVLARIWKRGVQTDETNEINLIYLQILLFETSNCFVYIVGVKRGVIISKS